jgi:hypothetical protein
MTSAQCIYRAYTKEWCGFTGDSYLDRTILLCMPCINSVNMKNNLHCRIIWRKESWFEKTFVRF